MRFWLLTLSLLLTGLSQAQSLMTFLASLESHPALEARRLQLEAAARQLERVYAPVAVNATMSYSQVSLSDPDIRLPDPINDLLTSFFDAPRGSTQLSLGASFRPFVFGDLRDLAQQRTLELASAQLAYRETLSELETQAVSALQAVVLAQDALELATRSVTFLEKSLAVTRLQLERGGASSATLRQAEARLAEAQAARQQALADLAFARATLAELVPDTSPFAIPALVPVKASLPSVTRARLELLRADIAVNRSERALYPTAQASYTWLIDEQHALAMGLESRTLQPSLTYRYQQASELGGEQGGVLAPLLPQARGVFSINIGVTITPEGLSQAEAAQAARRAAEAALSAAERQLPLTEKRLTQALELAKHQLTLAEQGLEHSRLSLAEAEARFEAGLVSRLELEEVALRVAEAALNLKRSEAAFLDSILESYRSYAVPLSTQLVDVEASP